MKYCSHCNSEFPDYFQFCGSCGRALTGSAVQIPTTPSSVRDAGPITSHAKPIHTGSKAISAPTLTILSSYSEPEAPSQFRWPHGLIVGFLLVLFVILLGIGGWYLWRRSITQTAQLSSSNPDPTTVNPSTAPSYQQTSTISPPQATIGNAGDEEIKSLRERRIEVKPSEHLELISALVQAERKYPTDYRFPYELSKLSIKGRVSHQEAFEPLARAAEKAIDNGQADEMLNSLTADKDEDFYKLSHGHHEWEVIEQALRYKDKKVLKATMN